MARTSLGLLLGSLVALTGCGPSAPPARPSPELPVSATASLGDAVIATRGGISIAYRPYDESGELLAIEAEGARTIAGGSEPVRGLCVVGDNQAVRIGSEHVEVLDGSTVHARASLEDAFGAPLALDFAFEATCSARSIDDVWVLAHGHLGHFDGEAWTSSEVATPSSPFGATLTVTDAYLWIDGDGGVYRRPRTGGPLERVIEGGAARGVFDVDATHAGILILDAYDGIERAEVWGDDGEVVAYDVAALVGDHVPRDTVRFDAGGGLWIGELLTDGESHTSLGGSTYSYEPYWYQAVVRHTDGTDRLVELGHVNDFPADGQQALMLALDGEELVVGLHGSLYRVAR